MIEIVGKELYQWDTGRVVEITGIEVEYVHFANKGDSKAVIMGAVDIHAQIPDFLLQTGKQLCVYAVKDGITVESKTFYVKHRERPENYVYEDDHRNYIYELITSAEEAIEEANLAAKNANEAADNASGLAFIGFAEGNSIHLDDAASQFLVGLRVFGKTTQDGTPTPEAPVDLVSVENPTVTVNDQTLLIPYTLHGIPVKSNGNYTDENGQQWVCDEVDFARGVYVQRTKSGNLYEYVEKYCTKIDNTKYSADVLRFDFGNVFDCKIHTTMMCNRFPFLFAHGNDNATVRAQECVSSHSTSDFVSVFIDKSRLISATLDGFKTYLQNNVTIVQCVINTPIETPLTEEELAAYAGLRTYRNSTTVSNDASAHMEIEYAMNAKKYIESIIANHAAPSRKAYVNLPASKWTGGGTLHSQVVSIAGITENSQVNLTPSVEQLSIFYEKDITFVTENDGGVVTVYVIGQKPTNDYTFQAEIVEVIE